LAPRQVVLWVDFMFGKKVYHTANLVEYQSLLALYRAGVTRVYVRFDWTEYGERSIVRRAENFRPNKKLWEAVGVVWEYLARHLDLNIDIVVEEDLFKGELGVEFSKGVPWGYFWGWGRVSDWKKYPPDVDFGQEIQPATEVERLLWEVQA
jgi:hypothetical protein